MILLPKFKDMIELKQQKNDTGRQGEKRQRTGGTRTHTLTFTASEEAQGCLGAREAAAAGRTLTSTDA